MALTKVTYIDNVTVIGAANLNAIQDEIIENGTNISALQSGKVDKDGSKVLSTNDFTNENLSKLNGIEPQATRVLVDTALSGLSTNAIQNKAVKDALDEQSQRIDNASGSVADVYTPQAYSIGDYVTHDNKLYRAIVDIPTAEVWDETHWEEVNVADVVAELQEDTAEVKGIAFAGFPTDTASGAIATLPDGADGIPIKSLSVAIEPVQDLHGYDYPWPAGGGKNLFPLPVPSQTKNGVTVEATAFGEIWIHGAPTITSGYISFELQEITSAIIGQQATISINEKIVGIGIDCNIPGGSLTLSMSQTRTNSTGTVSDISGAVRVNVSYDVGTIDKKFKVQLELGSTATAWSPYSNICPISGHAECNVTRTGKNLTAFESGAITVYGVHTDNNARIRCPDYIKIVAGDTYTFNAEADTALQVMVYFYADNNNSEKINDASWQSVPYTFVAPTGAKYTTVVIRRTSNTTLPESSITSFQLEVGSTVTDYEEYRGTTYPIAFPSDTGTIYGGNISDESLTVTYQQVVIDENVTISSHSEGSSTSRPGFVFENVLPYFSPVVANQEVLANWAIRETNASAPTSLNVSYWSVRGRNTNSSQNLYLYGPYGAEVTEEQLLTMLATNPLQVVIKIYSPLAYQIETPTIHTLLGQNNLWADCNGDVSVTYRADTALYVQKKIAEALNA